MDQEFVGRAWYKDTFAITICSAANATPAALFHAILSHRPRWMQVLLLTRNWLAARAGLDTPAAADIMRPEFKESYAEGERIGPWPIYHLRNDELVAGRDNKHLDFRISVLRDYANEERRVKVSTVCVVHNTFGKLYLVLVVPFHRCGVKWLMNSAVRAGRI